ncbi:MAG TPA: YciI family protein [Candidatus Dormibacteraeota bacterium]|nr:YciI family protein [Candidatus Dormibacteraeota bacterium]
MRFMVLVKANQYSEAGVTPDGKIFDAMTRYNEELAEAGVMLAAEGLQPSSKGARVKFSGENRAVIPGPFPETDQLIAGFWLWRAESLEKAIEWLKRAPFGGGVEIEIRPIQEMEDFGPVLTPELREREKRVRARMGELTKRESRQESA